MASQVLDVFTESLENLVNAYERGLIPVENFASGVRDLISVVHRIPRSVIIEVEGKNNG